ncbi:MAG: sodium:calcium antiporter [Candidatus Binatia bacterium]
MSPLSDLGAFGNIAAFLIASAIVWYAGDRLARAADAIAKHTSIGHAFIGVVLLGVVVSLPEMTFAAVAAARGSAELAVNGLLGGIGMSMVVVAITDFVTVREPLSSDVERPVVMLQGAMVALMLTLAAAGITAGDIPVPGTGVGVWTSLLIALYVISVYLVRHLEPYRPWSPDHPQRNQVEPVEQTAEEHARALPPLVTKAVVAAAAVVSATTVLAFSAELLAEQTGLGASYVGFLFGGLVTTLPELSTMLSSARIREFDMAFSDAFGTNLCSTGLIFLADAFYCGGPVLSEVGSFALFGVLVGNALTCIYLVGLVTRSRRTLFGIGLDSFAVLVTAAGGFAILYYLR